MSVSCNINGTDCERRTATAKNNTNNTVLGLILGSVAFLIFSISIVVIVYMLYCKRHFRNRLQFRTRSNPTLQNQQLPTNINPVQQQQPQSQLNPQISSSELPSTYQESYPAFVYVNRY
ncbi:unnamed protein product [Rotaria magnacalcarata]|uniref:Uncharacterized protein n=1 Tax=Rotaria magnacalcarata TaxID=392030 RepID=A0A819H0S7_9BILA|nr:unnamed protein product [Rotaria magnacalcarata]CAF1445670.1 unnamed protein product [Rotaria magnacalcarata]CAF2051346.1 unnamed protein product [Rotaria magnacalcarata]CAF2117163.1 unnamed protein product [Rotaria magnacalcarata]CAF2143916.1 unnamed protein product [Rotaria magnacalcarata]